MLKDKTSSAVRHAKAMSEITDALWAGYIYQDLQIELTQHRVTMSVSLHRGDTVTEHHLVFEGVRDLRLSRPGADWDFTEFTQAHVERSPYGFVIEIIFYNEENNLVIECEGIHLTET